MRYFSTFSGIGGFELGIQQAYETTRSNHIQEIGGGEAVAEGELQENGEGLHPVPSEATVHSTHRDNDHSDRSTHEGQPTCVGYSEIDKYAIQIYEKHFPEHKNYGDITKINAEELPDFDLLVGVSLAKHFLSRGNDVALKIPEGRCSLNLREYCEQNDLVPFSLKTSKDFSAMTMETLSEPSSPRLMSWGMTCNGKCVTAKITEYPRIGNASSLSDILEENPDPKYFLSEKYTERLLGALQRQDGQNQKPQLVQHSPQSNTETSKPILGLERSELTKTEMVSEK